MNRPRPRRVLLTLILVAGAGLTAFFLWQYRPALAILSEAALPLVVAVIVALAATFCGWGAIGAISRLAGAPPESESEPELSTTFLIGVSVFGTLAGLVAWVSSAAIPSMTVVLAVAGMVVVYRGRSRPGMPVMVRPEALLLVPPIVFGLVAAVSPVVAPDELIYKLAVPHAYELYGRMLELPLNSHSYFVMAQNLADLAALLLGGGVAAHFLHFAIFLASLVAVERMARRFSERYSLWAVIVFAYTPALMITAGWAFSEWGVLGLLVVSFERYQRWVDEGRQGDFAIAFAALGAAAAVKYTALPWIAVFGIVVVARERARPRLLLLAAAITGVFGAFFYVRNMVWTGSPVAPMFLPDAPAVGNYRDSAFLSGWRDFFTGLDIIDPGISDEALGVLLPLAILGVLLARWGERMPRDFLLLGLGQTAILLTMAPVTRNLITGLAPLAIVGAVVLVQALHESGRLTRALSAAGLAVILIAHVVLGIGATAVLIPYVSGSESPGAFLARTRPFAAAYGWIAESTPPHARVLLIGETRTFYLDRQFVSGGNLDGPRIAGWLGRFSSPDLMAEAFRREGITHVLFHPAWYRVKTEGAPVDALTRETLLEVPAETDAVLREVLSSRATLRYRDAEYLVFELR